MTNPHDVMFLTSDEILQQLKTVIDPLSGKNIVENEMVSGIIVKSGVIHCVITIPEGKQDQYIKVRDQAEKAIKAHPKAHLAKTLVMLTHHKKDTVNKTGDHPLFKGKKEFPNIQNIITVASGKGGVGKSTTSTNIAISLQKLGYKVGLLDMDIYGPSIPKMMGITEKAEFTSEKHLIPFHKYGIEVMSLGSLYAEDEPAIWRGPIVQAAVKQLLTYVTWGQLDYLIIDLPPGTGDIHLTLMQSTPITGSVIVSTPQDVALIDAIKAVKMFQKVDTPVLGVIENMSYFTCPHCHKDSYIFSNEGAKKTAERMNIPYLGDIPLTPSIRIQADSGTPFVEHDAQSDTAKKYLAIANKMIENISNEKDK